jgi:hypothetical protein
VAEETLVKESLTQEMVDGGWHVIRALRGRQIELSACFWLYSAETNSWKLVLSFPQVKRDGPKKAYQTIQDAIWPEGYRILDPESFLFRLYLDDITVLSPSDPVVRSILSVPLGTESGGVRFKRNRLGDSFFDDVYIYNLKRTPR